MAMAKPTADYARLDAGEIIATAERLARRIAERFPGSGLPRLRRALVEIGRRTQKAKFCDLDKPNVPIRIARRCGSDRRHGELSSL